MNASRVIVLALALGLPALCPAQWRWIDKNGQAVFSDQPPPNDVPAAKIVRQPGAKGRAPEPAAAASEPAARQAPPLRAAASAAKAGAKDKELQDKKKQAEAAEAEKKKAQEEEAGRMRADNCARARRSKATFDTGVRVARLNDKGEREFMDDAQRAAETKRLEGVIARDCKPAGSD
ncbi:DUF4124 domain-containing protein [Ramlibacter sp.]|uniref:DUF4124 domain-containing protein n=1 Tax=Ramlibacter sp. TaxID=1917967 RepID=UPI002B64E308|nr:DUF4124 domain-containing protein [Ramlibacter sp.]HWI83173.1 DUF4124 domain-containing protein [Ramlibacter sp.]